MFSLNEILENLDKQDITELFELKRCVDIGEEYAFYMDLIGADEKRPTPGIPILCVNKESGEVREMTIPPISNLRILKRGTEVQLPSK